MSLLLSSSVALPQGFRGKMKILFPVLQRSSLQSSLSGKGPSSPSSTTLWRVKLGKRKEPVQDYFGYVRLQLNCTVTWLQRFHWSNRNVILKKVQCMTCVENQVPAAPLDIHSSALSCLPHTKPDLHERMDPVQHNHWFPHEWKLFSTPILLNVKWYMPQYLRILIT